MSSRGCCTFAQVCFSVLVFISQATVVRHSLHTEHSLGAANKALRSSTNFSPAPAQSQDWYDQLEKQVKEDVKETAARVKNAEPIQVTVVNFIMLVLATLLPDYHIENPMSFFSVNFLVVLLSVAWFMIFMRYFYSNDRPVSAEEEERNLTCSQYVREEDLSMLHSPDLVLVFHHPEFEHPDKDDPVRHDTMDRLITSDGKDHDEKDYYYNYFPEFSSVVPKATHSTLSPILSSDFSLNSAGSRSSLSTHSLDDVVGRSFRNTSKSLKSRHEARTALLKDVCALLVRLGFDVDVFSSSNDTELYVCVSILREDTVNYFLVRDETKLKFRRTLASNLNIHLPDDGIESSTPEYSYYPELASVVHIDNMETKDMFCLYDGIKGQNHLIKNSARIRIIWRELSRHIDLDQAVSLGLMVDWYPAHWLPSLRQLRQEWGNIGLSWADMTLAQPMDFIRNYFGSRFAFLVAWSAHYAKCLLMITPPILVCGYVNASREYALFGTTLVIVIWVAIANRTWIQEENFFCILWDIPKDLKQYSLPNLQFNGERVPSGVDQTKFEKEERKWVHFMRMLITNLVTFAMLCMVVVTNFFYSSYFGKEGNVIAATALSLQIKVLDTLYRFILGKLVEIENHKWQVEQINSWMWKYFIFQSVNYFYPFIHMSVQQARYIYKQDKKERCVGDDCAEDLQSFLMFTFLILAICIIAESFSTIVMMKSKLWYSGDESGAGETHSVVEDQSKFGSLGIIETIDDFLVILNVLAFVIQFSAMVPLLAPFGFALVVMVLKIKSWTVLRAYRRPIPRKLRGLGEAWPLVRVMTTGSALVAGFQLVVYDYNFKHAGIVPRLTGFALFLGLCAIVRYFVDWILPALDNSTKLLQERRSHLIHTMERKSLSNLPAPSEKNEELDHIKNNKWSTILHSSRDLAEIDAKRRQESY